MSKETETSSERLDRELELWAELKPEPTPVLLDLLCDENELTRTVAAKELQVRGERVAFERAVELSSSTRDELREIAVFLIGQLGTPAFPFKQEAIPLLEQFLIGDQAPMVRETAAKALGFLRARTAVHSLINTANDPDAGVRSGVAVSLGYLGLPEARAVLKRLSEDTDEEVREWAECGLEMLDLDKTDED